MEFQKLVSPSRQAVIPGGQEFGGTLEIGTNAAREVDFEASDTSVFYIDATATKFGLKANKNLVGDAGTGGVDFSAMSGEFKTTSGALTFNGDITLAANKNLTAAGGTSKLDFSAASGVFKSTTGDVTFPNASGKIVTFGVKGSSNLPRIEFATKDADVVYADNVSDAGFGTPGVNEVFDRLKRSDSINLNAGGNFIDATRMGMEWTCEYEYNIADAEGLGGAITDATNATPIVITSAGHGYTVNDKAVVFGVTGNTAANGTFAIANVTADTFELVGSVGNGAYTGGGTTQGIRLTMERYQAYQRPGINAEIRPIAMSFNNDGLYTAFVGTSGEFTAQNTDATAVRLVIPEGADGVDIVATWGTTTHGGVSQLTQKNNIVALFQTGSGGDSQPLLKLDATGAGVSMDDVLQMAGSGNPVKVNGNFSIGDGKTFTQIGGGAFSTGTGAVSLNGTTTIAAGLSHVAAAGVGGLDFDAMTGDTALPTGNFSWLGAAEKTLTLTSSGAGAVNIESATGQISVGDTAVARTVKVGTGGAAQLVTVGSQTGASALSLFAGSGNLVLASGGGRIKVTSNGVLGYETVQLSGTEWRWDGIGGLTDFTFSNINLTTQNVSLAANKSLSGAAGTGALSFGSMTGDTALPTGSLSWAAAATKTGSLVSAGAFTITAGTASTWSTAAGALTITSADAATWSTAAGALAVDSAAGLNLGTTNATTIAAGNTANTTTWTAALKAAGTANLFVSADAHTINLATGDAIQTANLFNHATPANVVNFLGAASKLGFFGLPTAVVKQAITGSLSTVADAAAKAVLTSIIAALASATGYGLVTDSTT